MVSRVVDRDPGLWLSRSWTTREKRPGEPADAYNFVTRDRFEDHIEGDGFLEWAEFLGHLYGTPRPTPPPGRDVLLEIDVQGAQQVLDQHPAALLLFIDTPSPEVQADRLRGRGDLEVKVQARLAASVEERRMGRDLGAVEVINDDLDRAVGDVIGHIARARTQRT